MESGHEFVLWVVVIAVALHVAEEHHLDWLSWANDLGRRRGIHFTWPIFHVTNAALALAAIAAAAIGWRSPELALILPALLVINAVLFHILPTLLMRRYSPGTLTAVAVYLPVAAWAYWAADQDGVLSGGVIVASVLGGAALMAYPLLLAAISASRRPIAIESAVDYRPTS